MSGKYYATINGRQIRIAEDKYKEIYGTSDTQEYIASVYKGAKDISDVPEEYQKAVEVAVSLQERMNGKYAETEITAEEIGNAIKEIFAIKRKNFENFISALKALAWSGDNG